MSIDSKAYLKQLSIELHKRALKKFPRQKIFVNNAMATWSIDIADMNMYKDENDNIRFMLTCIDVFSRRANAVSIKDKTPGVVLAGFKKHVTFFEGKPNFIYSDQGSEFKGVFAKYCEKHKIGIYHTFGPFKASPIERFHRTLKDRLNTYFTENQTHRWIDILPTIIESYNNTKHSSIKMTPDEAFLKENHDLAFANQYGKKLVPPKNAKPAFELGDHVRISRTKDTFEKSGFNWSQEIYQVVRRDLTWPYRYWLKDELGEPIIGSFYEAEIQKTELADIFLVEKVLQRKTERGTRKLLIKWLGYSDKHNSWVNAEDVADF